MLGSTTRRIAGTALAAFALVLMALTPVAADQDGAVPASPQEAAAPLGVPPQNVGDFVRYPSADLPKDVPDNDPGGVTSTLEIDSYGVIDELVVGLIVRHTYVSDLKVVLTHVDTGTSVDLIDQPLLPGTGCPYEDIDAALRDSATTAVEDECTATPPAIGIGVYRPNEPLAAFTGENIHGTWWLTVSDLLAGDTGYLSAWQLGTFRPGGLNTAIYSAGATGTDDMASKILATGAVAWVDVFPADMQVPVLANMEPYDSVLAVSNFAYLDAEATGDVFADYVDGGGGLVAATFSFAPGTSLDGRIVSGRYLPLYVHQPVTFDDGPLWLHADLPTHPLLRGVTAFSGGTASYRTYTSPSQGATLVASWDSPGSEPLVAVKPQPGSWVVGLNFYPPSSDARADYWDASTDGDVLLANALVYAAATPRTCDGLVATIDGTDASETLNGTSGDDVIAGGGGHDRIQGGGGNDVICGGPGNDTLVGGPGDDALFGDAGIDMVGYGAAPSGVEIDLDAEYATGGHGSDVLVSIENANGSPYDDVISGTDGPNWLRGIGGDDTIEGRGGADAMGGGPGSDDLFGGAGDDTLDGFAGLDGLHGEAGNDLLRGWAGNDFLQPGPGDDVLKGGNGFDHVSYLDANGPITVDLRTGMASGSGADTLAGIAAVFGSSHGDTITGNWLANFVDGNAGDDVINGMGGDDRLFGGFDGDDVILGGTGNDEIGGGPGSDELRGGTGADDIDGEDGNDLILGGEGPDYLLGGVGSDGIFGGPGSDTCSEGAHYASCELIL